MKIFAFATHVEAEATVKLTKAKETAGHYTFDSNYIIITGIGPFTAYTTLLPFIKGASRLYNFGIAGTLDLDIDHTVCHKIASVSKLKWHPKTSSFHEPLTIANVGKALCTLDFPLYENPLKETLRNTFSLIDMEGYAIALLAKEAAIPLTIVKAVSDSCDKNTQSTIQRQLETLSLLLATEVSRVLDTEK